MNKRNEIEKLQELSLELQINGWEDTVLSPTTRMELLRRFNFDSVILKEVANIESKDIRVFMKAFKELINRLSSNTTPQSTQDILDDLEKQNYSKKFITMYSRLLNPNIGQKNDVIFFHFGSNMQVEQAKVLEDQYNELLLLAFRAHSINEINSFSQSSKIVEIREFKSIGSKDLVLHLTQEFLSKQFLIDVYTNIIANIVANVLMDVTTKSLRKSYRIVRNRRQGDSGVTNMQSEGKNQVVIDKANEIVSNHITKKRTQKREKYETYSGYRDGLYVQGFERIEEITTEEWVEKAQ